MTVPEGKPCSGDTLGTFSGGSYFFQVGYNVWLSKARQRIYKQNVPWFCALGGGGWWGLSAGISEHSQEHLSQMFWREICGSTSRLFDSRMRCGHLHSDFLFWRPEWSPVHTVVLSILNSKRPGAGTRDHQSGRWRKQPVRLRGAQAAGHQLRPRSTRTPRARSDTCSGP